VVCIPVHAYIVLFIYFCGLSRSCFRKIGSVRRMGCFITSKRKQCTEDEIVQTRKKNRPFTAQEVRNLLLNDSDEEALSDDDYHCSELESESETDTDEVDNVPDNDERHAVILLLFMGVGEPICAPSQW